jgi:hypothetical protein
VVSPAFSASFTTPPSGQCSEEKVLFTVASATGVGAASFELIVAWPVCNAPALLPCMASEIDPW